MIEPFTWIAIGATLLGWASRSGMADARARSADALSELRAAAADAKHAFQEATGAAHELDTRRRVYASWLVPRAVEAAELFQSRRFFFGQGATMFGGMTTSELKELARRARIILNPPVRLMGPVENFALRAALTLKALQWLDHYHQIPVLHQTLHDLVASVPIDGAHTAADALADIGLGDVGLFDCISDGLIAFSVIRIWRNFARTSQLNGKTEEYQAETRRMNGLWLRFENSKAASAADEAELKEAAYELYRATLLASATAQLQRPIGERLRGFLDQMLANTARRLWQTISPEARGAAT